MLPPGEFARQMEGLMAFNRGRPQAGEMRNRCDVDDALDDAPGDGGFLDAGHRFATMPNRFSRFRRGTF